MFIFLVHEDESDDADMEKIKLFSNHVAFCDGSKCHDSLRVPVYVADAIDPNIVQKPCYPKELVYADNVDRSMEEIRAQLYFERYCCKEKESLDVCVYLKKIYLIFIITHYLIISISLIAYAHDNYRIQFFMQKSTTFGK